ncbi:hypothetical protein GCM10022198_00320 [Klugiella xanthotipulae]|uniref:Uncharacterized protein n=1 Tax=Klugiella xanthotipulae TaxID=244735 RepID=A0A543I5U8_9MICO|nr:hypothetical protein [Klugiella xanthotipulae]TQM65830.1 hypothetical protein FB466_0643 [Klugiella xanthotipulae]
MAGVGPPPKDPNKRARRNKDVAPLHVVTVEPDPQPELPEFEVQVTIDGDLQSTKFVWPEATRRWWNVMGDHPLAPSFTNLDWEYLLDTARLHADYWQGNLKQAGELRLRMAKYGFTPEDRARLRISFAQATTSEAEARTKSDKPPSSRDRYGMSAT